jgi:hypothetical protein
MLYAMTRQDGSVAVTTVYPKEAVSDDKTLPITFVDGTNKRLTVRDGGEDIYLPLPSDDMRTIEADSVPGYTLNFYDIAKVAEEYPDPIVSYEKITVDQIPPTRAYRDAWAVSGKTIGYNMPRARDIHRTKLREARKPMLEALDIAYQRADEQDDGPEKRRIAAEKQKLRDITASQLIERANNIAALETLTVEYLLAHP